MRELILGLISILIIVVMASGCTLSDKSPENNYPVFNTNEIKANATTTDGEILKGNTFKIGQPVKITAMDSKVGKDYLIMDSNGVEIFVKVYGYIEDTSIVAGDTVTIYGQYTGNKEYPTTTGSKVGPYITIWGDGVVKI